MTWTYNPAETINRDKVRGIIGDTNIKGQLLTNEVIDAQLVIFPTVRSASIECLRRILSQTAGNTDRNAVGISSQRSQAWDFRARLLEKLESEANLELAPYAGGISQVDKDKITADTDYVPNQFAVKRDDNESP